MNTNSKAIQRSQFYLEKAGLSQHFYNIQAQSNILDFYSKRVGADVDAYIAQWLDNGCDIHENKGLFIYGASAKGKTVLSSYIIYTLMQKAALALKRGCLFVNLTAFIDMLRPGRNGGEELLDRALKIDLLVLDDFGTNVLSEWVFERLYFIINSRRDTMLPIIYTSNLSMDALKKSMEQLDSVATQRILTRVESTADPLFVK